jgi:hypothetical protein
MENYRPELYYAILNIVDYLALSDTDRETRSQLYRTLDKLLWIHADDIGEDISETFAAIADANDVGGVKSWQEMVYEFTMLFEKGERVAINNVRLNGGE